MYELINSILYYVIIFVIIVCFWHYGVPKVVKKEIKKLLGIFFRWLLFGKRDKEKPKKSKKSKKDK